MKLYQLSLSLGLAAFALASAPASAGDWNYGAGGMKGFGAAAVPVPAPVPVPEYVARYYFRVDAGFGFGDTPTGTEQGYRFGEDGVGGPWGIPTSWINSDFDSLVTFGVGTGVYVGGGFRLDVTAETRSQGKVKINGQYQYTTPDDGSGNYEIVRGRVKDETTLRGGIFLVNGYYDFDRGPSSRFTPYIGAGLGFAWNELKRNHSTFERELDCDSLGCNGSFSPRDSDSVQDKTHDIVFAASAMAGMTYRVSDYALVDVNYRYLYAGSTDVGLGIQGPSFGGKTKVTIGETHEHQIRAGLRFEVN